MSAVLRENQKLRRTVTVYGVGEVIIALTREGIEFKVPRTKVGTSMTWAQAASASYTPLNVPSKHEGRPLDFLKDQAAKQTKRAEKRADKKPDLDHCPKCGEYLHDEMGHVCPQGDR